MCIGEANENLKKCLLTSLVQVGLVKLCHFSAHANVLLCLQLHTVRSAYTVHASDPCWYLAVPTAAHSTVCTHSTCFWPMQMSCCAYSCTHYGLHTQYMLLTHADILLCLQLHTVRSAYTVHASDPCRCLVVPTAAHITVCIHSTCFWPMLISCCAYSCTQYGLHTQYMLLTNADVLLCLQLHTVRSAYTVHASDQCRCLAVPTAAHNTVSTHSTYF